MTNIVPPTESPEAVGAYNKGALARINRSPLFANPYLPENPLHAWYRDGWLDEASNYKD